ncbi:Pentatricopeptide repeat-containing protein [Thalictrum thalictroides]|uniref:Pentatricopeptide repeat-containing protein n=1 Tax=Thalictrum thalictroides TaxID=46969 RepID=A0A7J6UU67_THATH|nr:Pentatricopeptide repeat-containing protein [Thalictrum thalictroides]
MNTNNIRGNSETRSIVAGIFIKANRFQEAEKFMNQMLKDGEFFQKGIWDSLIQGICSAGESPEKAFSVLQDCLKFRGIISPSHYSFSLLIHCFSSLGNMGRAIEVLELMTGENFRYPFDNFVCSSVISGFCKIGKPELALGFYDNVEKSRALLSPNVVTYTAIVSALCKEGRVKEVCDLVYKMENEGVVLDAVFYSSWICGYFQRGILEEAFKKHREMLEKGIKPDTVSYTILIDGFSKEGNVEKAVGFLNEMKKDGLQPNLVTYTAIMRGFCKRRKLEEAFCIFKRVKELGITMDEITYSTLIDGFCRVGDIDRVFLLLGEMEKKGVSIGIITYNTVINGLCKFGRTTEADEISNSILGDNFTFSTLLHGYAQENNALGILETKRRVEEAGIHMDVIMCNVLIKASFMMGAFEDASVIFDGMSEMGIAADSGTYCTMIDGYCRTGRIDEALEIFDAFREKFSIANVGSYSYIIHALCENGMVDMAIDVFIEIIEKALVPERTAYTVLLRSIFNERTEEGILEFVLKFEELEQHIFHFIGTEAICFLCKKGCLKSAFDLYMLMRTKGLGVTRKCYYLILEGHIEKGNKYILPIMLNAYMKEYGLSESRMGNILLSYLCEKDVNKAIHLFDKMKETLFCYKIPIAAVEALTKQGRAIDAQRIILKGRGTSTSSDVVAYSIVVNGLCKEGHIHKALDLCVTMRNKGIAPNIVTYNSVMNGLCQQGFLVEALRLFDSLDKIGLTPSHITYGTLISALSKEGYLQDAKHLFEKMVLKGFTPHTHMYNSMIHGYCKLGLLDEALELLLSLEKRCYTPDAFTVSAVINGICWKGDMEGALTFYFDYKRKGILPDFFGFVYLIKGLCVKGRMEEARSIFTEMLQIQSIVELINKFGNEIAAESLASILVSLCEQGNIEQATSVLDEVVSGALSSRKRYTEATNLNNPNDGEVMRHSDAPNMNSGLEDSDYSSGKPILCDFDVYYSLIASLCSEGRLDQASQVAKELLLNV